jgi:uncharacterized protein
MNKNFCVIILGIFLISIVSAAIPKIEPYVNDFADILNQEEEIKLNLLSDNIEKNTSWEIAIVTVLNTDGQNRVEFAGRIGDENGVGKLNKDNGVVVLWSLDNEKGGAIATGRYSESILNDAKVGRIGREAREKYCDKEDYYNCFEFIVKELSKEISNDSLNQSNVGDLDSEYDYGWVVWLFGIIILVIFFVRYKSDDDSSISGVVIGSSSGGRSSGGSSFGGGSFGGGGAGQFGGYDGEVHKSWASNLAPIKTNSSAFNSNCVPIVGAPATLLSLIPFIFIIVVLFISIGMMMKVFSSAGIVDI